MGISNSENFLVTILPEQNFILTPEQRENICDALGIEINLNRFKEIFDAYIIDSGENKLTLPKFSIIMTSSMYNTRIAHSNTEDTKAFKDYSPELIKKINCFSGLLLMPNKIHNNFEILLNTKYVKSDLSYIGSFAHELTHLFDYTQYMNDYHFTTETELLSSENHLQLYYWSEFHARYYSFIYSVKFNKNFTYELISEQLQINGFFEYYMGNLMSILNNVNISLDDKLIELMSQYGRLSTYKKFNFNGFEKVEFPKDLLVNMFGKHILGLYDLMEGVMCYNDFKLKIDEIGQALSFIYLKYNMYLERING